MKCVLCTHEIANHRPERHSLRIDEHRTVEVCDACTRKFIAWHGETLAALFPSKRMKKRYGKRD